MSLTAGYRLGPYEILAPLGTGGMGEVYRARDTRLGRTVAVKILPSVSTEQKTRFAREAQAIASLTHPHICTLYDVGQHDTTDYLVMELLEGQTLAARLQQGPLAYGDVLEYGLQIAQALETAHRAGIVHRDLKPSNVMLTAAGAKLLDFGVAKLHPPASSGLATMTEPTPLTGYGALVGTLQYMAPERLEGRDAGPAHPAQRRPVLRGDGSRGCPGVAVISEAAARARHGERHLLLHAAGPVASRTGGRNATCGKCPRLPGEPTRSSCSLSYQSCCGSGSKQSSGGCNGAPRCLASHWLMAGPAG